MRPSPDQYLDGDDHYLDLLFFHRRMQRLVAIELKLGDFKAADAGQVELYLRWLASTSGRRRNNRRSGSWYLQAEEAETVEVLDLDTRGIHVAEYFTELPPRALLEDRLHRAIKAARERLALGVDAAIETIPAAKAKPPRSRLQKTPPRRRRRASG